MGSLTNKCNTNDCSSCECDELCKKYDNLPRLAKLKMNEIKTKDQRNTAQRIAERINYTFMCINGVCSNVR